MGNNLQSIFGVSYLGKLQKVQFSFDLESSEDTEVQKSINEDVFTNALTEERDIGTLNSESDSMKGRKQHRSRFHTYMRNSSQW